MDKAIGKIRRLEPTEQVQPGDLATILPKELPSLRLAADALAPIYRMVPDEQTWEATDAEIAQQIAANLQAPIMRTPEPIPPAPVAEQPKDDPLRFIPAPGYGWRLIDQSKDEPMAGDELRSGGVWVIKGNTFPFDPTCHYRRKIDVGVGYDLVPENELPSVGMQSLGPDGEWRDSKWHTFANIRRRQYSLGYICALASIHNSVENRPLAFRRPVKPLLRFPVLARFTSRNLVVRFDSMTSGQVIETGHPELWSIGSYDNGWMRVTDETTWTILEQGSLALVPGFTWDGKPDHSAEERAKVEERVKGTPPGFDPDVTKRVSALEDVVKDLTVRVARLNKLVPELDSLPISDDEILPKHESVEPERTLLLAMLDALEKQDSVAYWAAFQKFFSLHEKEFDMPKNHFQDAAGYMRPMSEKERWATGQHGAALDQERQAFRKWAVDQYGTADQRAFSREVFSVAEAAWMARA